MASMAIVNFCGACQARTTGDYQQVYCVNCGALLVYVEAPERLIPATISSSTITPVGSSEHPFEILDSPSTGTTTTVRKGQKFGALSGDSNRARITPRKQTTEATVVHHAGGNYGAITLTRKPTTGKAGNKGAVNETVNCTVQLHCGFYLPQDHDKSDRVQDWKSGRRVAVQLPMIPFDSLTEYLKVHVIQALPDTCSAARATMTANKCIWYPAIEMGKRDGPVQLSRNDENIKHGKDFVGFLHNGKGGNGVKNLHLCWEQEQIEVVDDKGQDTDEEDRAEGERGDVKVKEEVKKEPVIKKETASRQESAVKGKKIKKELGTVTKAGIKREDSVDPAVRFSPIAMTYPDTSIIERPIVFQETYTLRGVLR